MDARLGSSRVFYSDTVPFLTDHADPAKALGLEEGDAHVIRNAGGRTIDAIRSLVISQQLLGTREIVLVHHVCIVPGVLCSKETTHTYPSAIKHRNLERKLMS
jgi:hypothetical protein